MVKNNISLILERNSHWDELFRHVDYTQVLWHQISPKQSLKALLDVTSASDAVIDVGCGASLLVDSLLEEGYGDITLLDTSKTSLEIVQARLSEQCMIPKYINTDILTFEPQKNYDAWHDRAVFHFLLSSNEIDRYFEVLMESLKEEGIAILSTFAPKAETHCAGLQTRAYDKALMKEVLPSGLKLVAYETFTHITPKKTKQAYSMFALRKS